ncbi:hypothetical protein QA584_28420 [Anaerocolumna sp. AGMB13025]|uniref:hypothetical protein n=1 Tax=Anaerocolumna sp. AGMB13025 TaxID=3039116 RepID=UPI00241EB2B5|nr:hypothetical protein [Anaerocolumna sp. AGMB13025]WFR57483.1 hypothetical protein QA584_28420 [Anaerocolumna sp. AGMB13025]
MERVINLLYDIEEKANQIVKRANEEKATLYDKLQKDMEQFGRDIETGNKTKLEQLKVQLEKDLNLEKQSYLDDCLKRLDSLEADFLTRHTLLAEELFRQIIKS